MAANPFYNKAKLLLHFDGADGGTTFTDSGPLAITPTANGTITTSTAQKVFGTASLAVLKNGDLTVSAAQMPGPGTGDFTVRFRVRFVTASGTEQRGACQLFGDGYVTGPTTTIALLVNTGGVWAVYGGGDFRTTSTTITTGQWYCVAFIRTNGVTAFYVDGVKLLEFADTVFYSGGGIVGAYYGTGFRLDGYIDDFEVYYHALSSAVPTEAFGDTQARASGVVTVGGVSTLLKLRVQVRETGEHIADAYSGPVDVFTATTWNPLDKGTSVVLSNGNLQAATNYTGTVRSISGKSTGKHYFEVTLGSNASVGMIGIGNSSATLDGTNVYPGSNANSWAYYAYDGKKYHNGVDTAYGVAAASGHTLGVLLDMDAGTVSFIGNDGTNYGVAFSGLTGTIYAMVGGAASGSATTFTANFGATPFKHPVPSGAIAGLGTVVTTEDAVGTYSVDVPTLEECHVICMDADGGTLENDQIHRVLPA